MKKFTFSLLALIFFSTAFAQQDRANLIRSASEQVISDNSTQERCAQSIIEQRLMENPEYAKGRENAEKMTQEIIASFEQNGMPRNTYTIPVVFHIIHKGEAVGSGTNISDAQILSAVDALNRDFAATSADGGIAQSTVPVAAGNTNIQFCLASIDPNGNPTTGIVRVDGSSVTSYSSHGIVVSPTTPQNPLPANNELAVKNLSRWDNRYYLNIWVVSEIDNNGADAANITFWQGGTLGFAYLPQNPITGNSQRDGVVAVNCCVGNDPSNTQGFRLWSAGRRNRTLTHEVGHYLNLWHTFEGGSCSESNCNTQGDRVCDTPPTPAQQNCNTPACSGTQQVENYMDYTGETCYNMFSQGQATRMTAALTGPRTALVTNNNKCTPPTPAPPVANFTANQTTVPTGTTVNFTDQSTNIPTAWTWSITPATGWAFAGGSSATSQNPQVTFNTAGQYTVSLTASNAEGSDNETKNNYINVTIQSNYCAATTTTCDEFIQNISIGTINNTSGCTNYGDYTAQSTSLVKGQTYTINFVPQITNQPVGSAYANNEMAVWIDFNNDETFDNSAGSSERIVYQMVPPEPGTYTTQFTFTVPTNAVTGAVRMRARISFSGNTAGTNPITPCGTVQYGEVEDYTINILPEGTSTASIEEKSINDAVLYPNPTSGSLFIDLSATGLSQFEIGLFDLSGKLLFQDKVEHVSQYELDMTQFATGMYQVRIVSGGTMKVAKVSKL